MSQVCANCFQNKTARKFIRENGSLGDCAFCQGHRKVLHARELKKLFGEVLRLYQPYEAMSSETASCGDSLAECMAEWDIFSEDLEADKVNELLDEIRGYDPRDGDLSATEGWEAKSNAWYADPVHLRWPTFADYLKRNRRFVFEADPSGELVRPETWVPDLLEESGAVREIGPGTRLHRGRMGFVAGSTPHGGRQPRPAREMGAPPPELAKAGRANPEGIPFLYCALEPSTAIVETGRFPGAVVSIREFRPRRTLRLADLARNISGLDPLDTMDLRREQDRRTLLWSLGQALGEPVHPDDSNLAYLPTQYLAEVIRSAGYDGVCYPSALNPEGKNVAIFDPADARVTRKGSVFDVSAATYTIHPTPER